MSDLTPPERITLVVCPVCKRNNRHTDLRVDRKHYAAGTLCPGTPAPVSYVPESVVDALREERDAATDALEGIAHHAPGRAGIVARDALVAMGVWNATVEADERPEAERDALREENERLREQREVLREWMRREFGVVIEGEGRNPDGVMQDAETMLLCVEEIEAERDALRARVEELGAGLRDLLTLIGDLRSEDYVAGWEADPPVNRARDLLFGGSQEPRPDTGWKLGVEAQRERDEKDARLGIRHRRPDTKETKT